MLGSNMNAGLDAGPVQLVVVPVRCWARISRNLDTSTSYFLLYFLLYYYFLLPSVLQHEVSGYVSTVTRSTFFFISIIFYIWVVVMLSPSRLTPISHSSRIIAADVFCVKDVIVRKKPS